MSLTTLFVTLLPLSSLLQLSLSHPLEIDEGSGSQRKLLGFKEKADGGNTTFQCSPSGPCVPCLYSEKNDDKYRCSETGYRIPFKCLKIGDASKEASDKGSLGGTPAKADKPTVKHRTLADTVSGKEVESQEYVTYRSCIQGVNEEKLSVLGFEVLMLGLLLVSGSFVLFRQKKTLAMAGVGGVRVQSNSRF